MPIDYGARDKAVRLNVYASVRRRDGLPHELFTAYWRDVHSTLCSRLPGLGFYVQQHFDRDYHANLWPSGEGVGRISATLDGSAELGFATGNDQATFVEASTILYADEQNLFSEAVAYNLPTGSITFVDRDIDDVPNGADRFHRLHVYMNRRPGGESETWLKDTSATLAQHDVVQKWKLHLPEPYDNERPAPPSPNVDHTVGMDRLNVAVIEAAFASARAAREFYANAHFKKMLGEQSRYVDAVGAYLVSGIYTFVRDGKLTTAGLRGSRQAELIEKVGAANQLAPEVVVKFAATGAKPAASEPHLIT